MGGRVRIFYLDVTWNSLEYAQTEIAVEEQYNQAWIAEFTI